MTRAWVAVTALGLGLGCGGRDPRVDEYRMVRDEVCACRRLACVGNVRVRADYYDARARTDFPSGLPDDVRALQREYHGCLDRIGAARAAGAARTRALEAELDSLTPDLRAAEKAVYEARQHGDAAARIEELSKRAKEIEQRYNEVVSRLRESSLTEAVTE